MKLTESERLSPLWDKITEHLSAQIEANRMELERTNKPPSSVSDDVLRGMILANRRLLAKGKDNDDVRAAEQ